jgi:phosphinothricin acetyltransferase
MRLPVFVRPAAESDLASIAGIYAHYVRNSAATFETEPPDVSEMARRWAEVGERGLPWLVAEAAGGTVAGYVYASAYRTRAAYRFTVEDSIYIDPTQVGNGVGSALLERLLDACAAAGARQVVAVIGDTANEASVRLHAKFGFRYVGVLQGVGFKFGCWMDTILMQRQLV